MKRAVFSSAFGKEIVRSVDITKNLPRSSYVQRLAPRVTDNGTPFIIGKAKKESGTYQTLQEWSESEGFPAKPKTWQFQMGSLEGSASDTNPLEPSSAWVAEDPARYVTARNWQTYHYVPENEYVYLWQQFGGWYFDFAMPQIIHGTLDSLLNTSTAALITVLTSGGFGGTSGKCRVHTNMATGYNLLAGTKVYASLTKHSGNVRYEVISVDVCPTVEPEDE